MSFNKRGAYRQTSTPLKSVKIMKAKLTIIAVLLTSIVFGQSNDYIYTRLSIDPNNLLGVVDNPRTTTETTGLDFDIEAGARYKRVGVYVTYGRFEKIGYQNYAGGLDYYVPIFNKVQTSLGLNYGVVQRRIDDYFISEFDVRNDVIWKAATAIAFRGVVSVPINNWLSVVATGQYQERKELREFGDGFIFEGSLGIEIKFNRKNRKSYSRWKNTNS